MEIEILTATVEKQVLKMETLHTFVADTQNIYTASFSFDDEWDGFARVAIFRNDNNVCFALLDGENRCTIPVDVIKAGYLEIGVHGNKDGQVITTRYANKITVFKSGGSINMVPAPFEQSEFDKLMDELAKVRQIAEKSIADAAQSHADAEQVAADKTEVANDKAVVLQKAAEVANNAKVATTAADTATAQAGITQNLYNQLQPMNADVSSKAPAIVSEAAGSVITLDDSSNMPLQSLTIHGKSTQDGTPTPEAPVEIVSVENPVLDITGSNLFDLKDNRIYYSSCVKLDDGRLRSKINNGYYSEIASSYADFVKILSPGKEVCFSVNGLADNKYLEIMLYGKHKENGDNYVQSIRGKVGSEKVCMIIDSEYTKISKVLLRFNRNSSIFTDTDTIFSDIYFGLIDSPYMPYTKQSLTFPYILRGIPVTSGGNYTDESGQQWVCDTVEINADGTGKLVQRCIELTVNKFINAYDSSSGNSNATGFFTNGVLPEKMQKRAGFCDKLVITQSANRPYALDSAFLGVDDRHIYVLNSSFYDSTLDDKGLSNYNAYLADNPLKIVTYSASAIETDLTTEEVQAFLALHTNKPYSTIFNSAGADQKVEYVADTKKYIDNKFTELQNAILSTGGNV